MTQRSVNVTNLDDNRVTSLIAWGALPRTCRAALSVLDLFSETPNHSGARLFDSLMSDLHSPAIRSVPGPLSFQQLMMPSYEESQELAGRSLLEALTRPEASHSVLEILAEYGQLLCNERFLLAVQLTGVVIHVLALAALCLRHGKSLEAWKRETTAIVLRAVAECNALPETFRAYANQTAFDLDLIWLH